MRPTLLLAGVVAFAAAVVYAHVARRLALPRLGAEPPRPLRLFALWWGALALNIGLVGATYVLGAFDALTLEVQLVDSLLQRILLAVSMVGLMHYLLFLLTGRDLLGPLVVAYAAYLVGMTYLLLASRPETLFVGDWRTDVVPTLPGPAWAPLVSLLFILAPPIVASALCLGMARRLDDPARRFRLTVVSLAILAWWLVAVVAGQRTLLDVGPVQTLNRALSLAAALAVLVAYEPPAWARRRFGARGYADA